jgi:hypothetical protein
MKTTNAKDHGGLTRKGFMAGAAGLVALGTAWAGTDSQLDGELRAIASQLGQVGNHLERIEAVFADTPDGVNPPNDNVLRRIKSEAQNIIVTADDMLGRV